MLNPNAQNNKFNDYDFIPFGINLDRYKNRHLINKTHTPRANNVCFRPGMIEKRTGVISIIDVSVAVPGTEILGYIDVNMQDESLPARALVFTGIPGNSDKTARTGKVYEWNYVTDSTDTGNFGFVDITPELFAGGLASTGFHDSLKWRCINHYDKLTGEWQTLCTNGDDHIMKYVQTGGDGGAHGVMTTLVPETEIDDSTDGSPTYYIGKYLASYYNTVYVANITDTGTNSFNFSGGKEFTTGTHGLHSGDIIYGQTSGARAVIVYAGTDTGWATGTQAGTFTITERVGCFVSGEKLSVKRGATTTADICTLTSGTGKDPFAYVWTKVYDSSNMLEAENYNRITEDGLPINGMIKYANQNLSDKDVLIISKGGKRFPKNQMWMVWGYDNYRCVYPTRGFSNHDGAVLTAKNLYYNDRGRIIDYAGNDISLPISLDTKGSDTGTWETYAVDRDYHNEVWFSIGKTIFVWKEPEAQWEIHEFPEDVEVKSVLYVALSFKSWPSPISKHIAMSVVEEDTTQNVVLIYNKSILAMTCSFSDDNNEPIEFLIETPTVPISGETMQQGIVRDVVLKGEPTSTTDGETNQDAYTLYGCFSKVPLKVPTWTELGEMTLDENGEAHISCRNRATWATFRITNNSTKMCRLYELGYRAQPSTYK